MILAFVLLVPVVILSLWFFLRFSPKDTRKKAVLLYNAGVVAVSVLICGAMTFRFYTTLAETSDRAWWPVLSALGSLVVFPLCVAVGGVIRNLLVFRHRSGPGTAPG
jgi:hypothetical protein